jgi:hypothetical protein
MIRHIPGRSNFHSKHHVTQRLKIYSDFERPILFLEITQISASVMTT